MKTVYDIIRRPILTEKSHQLIDAKMLYTFEVDRKANKVEIKNAIEKIFNVKVVAVKTINVHPKNKRVGKYEGQTSAYKKAIIRLAPGQSISSAFEQ